MKKLQRLIATLLLLVVAPCAMAAGQLGVSNAWIPQAPPGVEMLAGYLTLKNSGDAAVSILAAQSSRFLTVTVHQTVIEDGVSRMRELNHLEIAPGEEVKFAPGGLHLMLMQPRREVLPGERIEITFLLSDGQRVPAMFDVQGQDATGGAPHEHHH
jgi:copper(I)-binding protein